MLQTFTVYFSTLCLKHILFSFCEIKSVLSSSSKSIYFQSLLIITRPNTGNIPMSLNCTNHDENALHIVQMHH